MHCENCAQSILPPMSRRWPLIAGRKILGSIVMPERPGFDALRELLLDPAWMTTKPGVV